MHDADLLRTLRSQPLFADAAAHRVEVGREGLEALLPHREPFLLVDRLTALDRSGGRVRGHYRVREDDPILAGHFPGEPVYPGCLQLEVMAQVALCLLPPGQAAGARALKVHHALYLAPVLPGDDLTAEAALVEDNGLTALCAARLCVGERLCSLSIQEVYLG